MQMIFLLISLLTPRLFANNVMFGAPVSASVTTSSARIMPQNGLRTYLIIVNTGSNPAIVKFGSVQSGTEGIPIPAGGNYEPFEAPSSSIYAVTASSTTTLQIVEGQ